MSTSNRKVLYSLLISLVISYLDELAKSLTKE